MAKEDEAKRTLEGFLKQAQTLTLKPRRTMDETDPFSQDDLEEFQSELEIYNRDPVRHMMLKLRSGVCHVTSAEGFRGIRRTGAILPNDGSRPYTFPQSANSHARIRGCISLFDFERASDADIVRSYDNWENFFTRHRPVTLVLQLRRERLPSEPISSEVSRAELGIGHTIISWVEILHPGPIPLAAVESVFLVRARPFRYRKFGAADRRLSNAEGLSKQLWPHLSADEPGQR